MAITGYKQTVVGQFFEELGHRIIGGELARNQGGDICLWQSETTVEVKSSGHKSSYGFRLDIDQIDHCERLSEFPFNRAWYMFFAYQNDRQINMDTGRRTTELAKHQNPIAINSYLARKVSWCVIVDLEIVKRWRDTITPSTKSIMGHLGTRTVNLKCQQVHSLANGGFTSELEKLELDPCKFGKLSGTVRPRIRRDLIHRHTVQFPLVAVLPRAEIGPLQKSLRRRGFLLQR